MFVNLVFVVEKTFGIEILDKNEIVGESLDFPE
jgi:hypothetical protein